VILFGMRLVFILLAVLGLLGLKVGVLPKPILFILLIILPIKMMVADTIEAIIVMVVFLYHGENVRLLTI